MNPKAIMLSCVVLAALALAVWKTMSPPGEEPARETVGANTPPVDPPQPAATPDPAPPVPAYPAPKESSLAESHPADTVADSSPWNETSLIGTKWEREGFGLEFGADGKFLIGGRERAQWRVEGSRIRLYRDTTGEEHWLDIVGDKLMWEGREIGRVQ